MRLSEKVRTERPKAPLSISRALAPTLSVSLLLSLMAINNIRNGNCRCRRLSELRLSNAEPKQIELNVAARTDVVVVAVAVVDAAAACVQKNQHVRPCPIVPIHRDSFAFLAFCFSQQQNAQAATSTTATITAPRDAAQH